MPLAPANRQPQPPHDDLRMVRAMTAKTAGQAPELFARWWRITNPAADDARVAAAWGEVIPADHEFWTELDDAEQQVRLAREDRDQLRKRMLDLAAEFERDSTAGFGLPGMASAAVRLRQELDI
jgi:hypothetical protein